MTSIAISATRQPASQRVDDAIREVEPVSREEDDLIRLLERDAALDRSITGARTDLDMARRRLVSLARERAGLSRSIDELETRLANARRSVAELDRPLVRRRHRVELDTARHQLDWVPRAIRDAKDKLAEVERQERQSAERLLKATAVDKRRPELTAERTVVRSQLDHDACLRGDQLAATPPEQVLERFGPQPAGEAGRLWAEAVGRVAQHRSAFDQHGREILGRSPGLLHDDVYATSYWAARQVVERADRVLGRELAIEPPHRSLGISR